MISDVFKIKQFKQEINNLELEKNVLTEKNRLLSDSLNLLTKEQCTHKEEISQYKSKINKLNDLIIKYTSDVDKLKNINKRDIYKIDKSEKEIQSLKDSSDLLQLLIQKTKSYINSIRRLNYSSKKEISQQQFEINELSDLVTKYTSDINTLNSTNVNNVTEIDRLKKISDSLQLKLQKTENYIKDNVKQFYLLKLSNLLQSIISNKNEDELKKKERKIKRLDNQIIELNNTILLQNFGLYEPTYCFTSSDKYKDKLEKIRSKQKKMVLDKTAAICATQFTLNNSIQKGTKMINDNIQQTVLMFNTECENAISNVKFNNVESMKNRIQRMYDKLNRLNKSTYITISPKYLDLKFKELSLAYEYAQKKQEEKEYIKEQREIQRENAQVQKEIEAERKRIEKEQAHYLNNLARIEEQMQTENNEARKAIIQEKIDAIKNELLDLDKALEEVDYRQANERAGYVYIISNIGAFGEGVYKIGMTRRLDPMDRIDELGGASVPFKFDVHAFIFSTDAPKLETALHNAFSDKRINMINGRKEFFRVSLKEIEKVVKKNHDKTVEFKYVPTAEQYRETLKMCENNTLLHEINQNK